MEPQTRSEKARDRAATWRKNNAEKHRAYFQRVNRIKTDQLDAVEILKRARDRARKHERAFDLTVEWVELQLIAGCALSGLDFNRDFKQGRTRPFAPSIDRIDSNQDYTQANSRVILTCLNTALSDWGLDIVAPIWRVVLRRMGTLA